MSDHKGEIVGSEPGEWSDVSGRRKAARREREKWQNRRGGERQQEKQFVIFGQIKSPLFQKMVYNSRYLHSVFQLISYSFGFSAPPILKRIRLAYRLFIAKSSYTQTCELPVARWCHMHCFFVAWPRASRPISKIPGTGCNVGILMYFQMNKISIMNFVID